MVAAAMKHMASRFAKLEKFEGVDFRRWKKKMHFMLSSMSVVYVLTTHMPEDERENPTVEQVRKRAKMFILSKSYGIPWKPNIWLMMPKKFLEELTLVELGSHLRIEESLRAQDNDKPKGNNVVGPSVVNMVEHNNSFRYNDHKGKRKNHDTRANPNKISKVTCWKCGKLRHLKKDCKGGNIDNRANGSSTKGSEDAFFVEVDDVAWWVDSGATMHVCKDRCWFKTYESLNDGSILHMENESTALVHRCGYVDLRLGHVHFKRMQDMSKDGLISAIDMDTEKYEALDKFKVFKTEVKLQQESLIKRFRTDRGVVSKRVTDEIVQQSESELKKSKRQRTPKDFGPKFQLYLIEGTRDEISNQHFYCFNVEDNPKTFDEAMQPLGFKWIFKRKLKVDGTVEKFKARLVIQGFNQKSGIDYFDTYAHVARISTIRLLITMALIHNLIIHQMDVKTAFLNGDLKEEVYMKQPLGFIMPGNENKVCKLIKSLYGLKQAPKQWHQKFNEVVLSNGYLLNQADKFQVDLTKQNLSSRFSTKDIGEADVILGIRIKHESNGIAISQSHYIENVLKKLNYSDCTPVSTPLDTCEKLMPNKGAGKEAEWLKNLLFKIPLWVKPITPISISCDSAATLAKAYSHMYNGKSRHLGVRHSMIHELITNEVDHNQRRSQEFEL
nr:zinc finger, CCHC-type [Tanacetum cinerariifolium]